MYVKDGVRHGAELLPELRLDPPLFFFDQRIMKGSKSFSMTPKTARG